MNPESWALESLIQENCPRVCFQPQGVISSGQPGGGGGLKAVIAISSLAPFLKVAALSSMTLRCGPLGTPSVKDFSQNRMDSLCSALDFSF